jgi:hypothetical protein
VIQTSADGWIQQDIGAGHQPAIQVTATGERHVLLWGLEEFVGSGIPLLYSNSLRGFATWTEVGRFPDLLLKVPPFVIDEGRGKMYAIVPRPDRRGHLRCSSAYTGNVTNTGTSWSCAFLGDLSGTFSPALALGPDGTLHAAWSDNNGLGYANSLGSFLATNLTPRVSFGTVSSSPSAAIVPSSISDQDGDDLAGHIHIGQFKHVTSRIEPETTEPIFQKRFNVFNANNVFLYDTGARDDRVKFKAINSTVAWGEYLYRTSLPPLPAQIEVQDSRGASVGAFLIVSWEDSGAVIVQAEWFPHVSLEFTGTLPSSIDISAVPEGATMVGIGVSDKTTSSFRAQQFTKTAGQNQLVLTSSAVTTPSAPGP